MRILITLLFCVAFVSVSWSQEICNNGIDDDGDGLIDLNDSVDCACASIVIPSLIPNPSFEQNTCCPTSFSQVTCAVGWSQATSATSDYFACGFNFGAATSAGLSPPPDGTAYLGAIFANGWQEYVGSCLSSPLLAGTQYTIQMNIASTPIDGNGAVCNGGVVNYPPIDITIFGKTTCTGFPIVPSTTACPSSVDPAWVVLGTATYTPVPNWGIINITFTPTTNINSVMIGSPCALPVGYSGSPCYPYFYFDNLILQNSAMFGNSVTQTGQWCNNNIQIATAPITGSTYQWYLDGVALVGETGLTLSVSVNSYGTGIYTIVTTDAGGICSSARDTVILPPFPTANYTTTSSCDGLPMNFIDGSSFPSGTITNWNWDFGDGNTSSLQNPSHVYSGSGSYTLVLIVTGNNGCTDTVSIPVNVLPNPVPDFSVGNFSVQDSIFGVGIGICEFNNVNFSDNSTISPGNITGWNWDFGDGNTSTLQNPSHFFSPAGTYNIQLNVASDSGCVDSVIFPLTISPKPVSDFSVIDDCVYNSLVVNNLSTVSPGSIVGLNWDFGDGTTSNSFTPSHTYLNDGIYNVTLIAVSDSGCSDTVTIVTERYPIPLANFTPTNVCLGDSVCYVNNSTINPSDTLASYSWDFGDSSPTQTSINVCHVYGAFGIYNTTLVATSNHGCVDDTIQTVTVYELPVADFNFTTVCENEPPTQFTDISQGNSGSITSWNWNFSIGTSVSQNPSFTFPSNGTYPVTLIVSDSVGCNDTIVKNIPVKAKPTADFYADTTNGCIPLCVNFQDTSISNSINIISWQWDLGNNTSNASAPSNCYNIAGDYNITLIVQNDLSCYDTLTRANYITVYPLPTANFTFNPDSAYAPSQVAFTDTSTGTIVGWLWYFGDNINSSTIQNPTNNYPSEGSYPVTLIVTDSLGCSDTTIIELTVLPETTILVPNVFTPNGDGINDIFTIKSSFLKTAAGTIYNRWGQLLFKWDNVKGYWDGRTLSGVEVPDGTYFYIIEFETLLGKKELLKGSITLIR